MRGEGGLTETSCRASAQRGWHPSSARRILEIDAARTAPSGNGRRPMSARAFPVAALVLAHDAAESDAPRVAEVARAAAEVGATPVVVAAPFRLELPSASRLVRTRAGGSAIAAIRVGMAQLTNTVARAAIVAHHGAAETSLVALLALVDEAKRSTDAIVAFERATLDGGVLVVPRDAWLELVTLGEGGMSAVVARRRVVRVPAPPDTSA